MKKQEKPTRVRLMAMFYVHVIVTTCVFAGVLLRGLSAEAAFSSVFSLDLIASIFLVSISIWISSLWRYKLVWMSVSIVPSLIWQPVGIPFILVTPFFDEFSSGPALVTLGMTILFWSLERFISELEDPDSGEMTTLNLVDGKNVEPKSKH